MFTQIAFQYNKDNWDYLDIPVHKLKELDDLSLIWFLPEERKYGWAHQDNIENLFRLCICFPNKEDVFHWLQENVNTELKHIHHTLIDLFCYPTITCPESLDEVINKTDDWKLIDFILRVLDRALLWNEPDPCYKSDFHCIVHSANEKKQKLSSKQLLTIEKPKVKGVYLVSIDEYTHIFYKIENLIHGIEKGELYYDIKDLAKQAHQALLKSLEIFFEHRLNTLDGIEWEKDLKYGYNAIDEMKCENKINTLIKKETDWCIHQLIS